MVVYRHEALADPNAITEEVLYDVFDVELTRKRGKGFGMAIVEHKSGRGLYISRLVCTFLYPYIYPLPVLSVSSFVGF